MRTLLRHEIGNWIASDFVGILSICNCSFIYHMLACSRPWYESKWLCSLSTVSCQGVIAFQDYLPRIPLSTQRALSPRWPEQLLYKHHWWLAILRPSSKYKSVHMQRSVPGDLNIKKPKWDIQTKMNKLHQEIPKMKSKIKALQTWVFILNKYDTLQNKSRKTRSTFQKNPNETLQSKIRQNKPTALSNETRKGRFKIIKLSWKKVVNKVKKMKLYD